MTTTTRGVRTYFFDGSKDGDTEVGGPGLGGRDTSNHVGTVLDSLFCVEGTLYTPSAEEKEEEEKKHEKSVNWCVMVGCV